MDFSQMADTMQRFWGGRIWAPCLHLQQENSFSSSSSSRSAISWRLLTKNDNKNKTSKIIACFINL